jgi:hypothetical protein
VFSTVRSFEGTFYRQISRIVKRASDAIGLLDPIIAHDVRRGAAREIALMPHTHMPGKDTTVAVLGHGARAQLSGITDAYIGSGIKLDLQDRLNLDLSKDSHFDIAKASTPYAVNRATRSQVERTTNEVVALGEDPQDRNARRRVRYSLDKVDRKRFKKDHDPSTVTDEGEPSREAPVSGRTRGKSLSSSVPEPAKHDVATKRLTRRGLKRPAGAPQPSLETDGQSSSSNLLPPPTLRRSNRIDKSSDGQVPIEVDGAVDLLPQPGVSTEASDAVEFIDISLILNTDNLVLGQEESRVFAALTGNVDEFVTRCSSINVHTGVLGSRVSGNSRDAPARF